MFWIIIAFVFTPYKIGCIILLPRNEGAVNMTRTFIELPIFSKRWKEIGLGDLELRELQLILLKDPESGPVIE